MTPRRALLPITILLLCLCVGATATPQDALSYDIDLILDYDSGSFEAQCVVNYTNVTGHTLSELFFRLFANDAQLYGNASIDIASVFVQTRSLSMAQFVDDTVLMVPLDTPLQPDEHIVLTFEFSGQTSNWPDSTGSSSTGSNSTQSGYGLLTKSSSALTMTAFYPLLAVYSSEGWALDPSTGFGDTLMGDIADYNVTLTVQSGPTPVTSGTRASTTDQGNGQTTYVFTAPSARDFALVLIEDTYQSKIVNLESATISAWFETQPEITAERTLEMASVAFEVFENLVGPSPFDDIDFVEVPLRRAAGVEFSGLILVSSLYTRNTWDPFFSVIISHEMAHQWFYAGVGNDVSEHPWLDESLATYLSYEFLNAYEGPDRAQAELEQWSRTYTSYQGREDLSIASPKYAFPNSTTYSAFVYSGGATFFHALRETLGADAFYQALQAYYNEFLHRIATPADLLRVFEESCSCTFDELLSEFRVMP